MIIGLHEQIVTSNLFNENKVTIISNENQINISVEYEDMQLLAKITHKSITYDIHDTVGYNLIEIQQCEHAEVMGHVILHLIDSMYSRACFIYVSDGSKNDAFNAMLDCYPFPRFFTHGSHSEFKQYRSIQYRWMSTYVNYKVSHFTIIPKLLDEYIDTNNLE